LDDCKEKLSSCAHKAGFIYQVGECSQGSPLFSSFYTADSGLMILSRFPILSHDQIYFSSGIDVDAEA
jgi:hypothetical protein